jgi:hypothetical protein
MNKSIKKRFLKRDITVEADRFFFQGIDVIETRTRLPFLRFLGMCIDIVEKKSGRDILSGIGELLDGHQKQWVRSKLKNETLFLLRLLREVFVGAIHESPTV